jgi:hypothetical protein
MSSWQFYVEVMLFAQAPASLVRLNANNMARNHALVSGDEIDELDTDAIVSTVLS